MKYLITILFALCLGYTAQAQSRTVTPSDVTTVVEIDKGDITNNDPLRKDVSGVTTRNSVNAEVTTVAPSGVTVDASKRDVMPRTNVDMDKTVVYDIPKREKRKRDDR